ncbi:MULTISPECIES: hypothetical protein [unclassified Bradyrhizobium]
MALLLAGGGSVQVAAQALPEVRSDQEAFTDPSQAEGAGFQIIQFDDNKETGLSALIAKEFVAKIATTLPEPAPGWTYAMKDLDGDGGPELFLRVMHWTQCELGCPVHIYRFDLMERQWKELFVVNASLLGIKPPQKSGERPEIAVLSDGPGGRGPTTTTYYRWERNDKFIKIAKPPAVRQQGKGK